MEKAFKINGHAKYYIDLEKFYENVETQRVQVKEFFEIHNIEANKYYVGGNGFINQPFEEYWKEDITLSLLPTDNDKENFSKMLKKPYDSGMCDFKKKSKINKEFQNYCIENNVVINLAQLDLRDYLKSLDWQGYSRSLVKHNDMWYLKVQSDLLKDDDVPEGFIEIKMSEFYKVVEESKEDK